MYSETIASKYYIGRSLNLILIDVYRVFSGLTNRRPGAASFLRQCLILTVRVPHHSSSCIMFFWPLLCIAVCDRMIPC